MDDDVTALPARMLGLDGFEVLAAGEVGGELELLVQTTDTLTGCPGCGVVATAHGRRDHLVRRNPRDFERWYSALRRLLADRRPT